MVPNLNDLLKFLNLKGMKKLDEANEIVNNSVLWSMGAGLVPIPIIDVAAVTAVQLNMINRLCQLYNVEYSESAGKSFIAALSGGAAARLGASLLKTFVPGFGLIAGGVSMSILSGATTYAVGQVFISHFEAKGTLENLNIEVMKRFYEEQLEKGKEFASRLQRDKEHADHHGSHASAPPYTTTTTADASDSVIHKLEKLNDLKAKGIITEEEFAAKKQSLLEQL